MMKAHFVTYMQKIFDRDQAEMAHPLAEEEECWYLPFFGTFDYRDLHRQQWRQVQHLANVFWNRWRHEYLPTLQSRSKWQDVCPNIQEDDLVLLKDKQADQKRGKKGDKRKEQRQVELGILQLFEDEGQKLIKAAQDKRDKAAEEIEQSVKEAEKQMAEISVPFSHTDPVKKPPPYEREVRFEEVYPQLPVISQEGTYHIRDEDGRMIERGQVETTIKTYPSSKTKKETTSLKTKHDLRIRRREVMMIKVIWRRSWVDMTLQSEERCPKRK
ncbi:hypothetical protein NFI96_002188 [Prochilodus magdalenae]|nr:hypothetical protein NFI96_002188 [Prochilodus magdalenae]